ncbi:hypothetical protein [Thermacetogenium phaeum]|nr:hypothetical protein [Thermacetogenium phaeum]
MRRLVKKDGEEFTMRDGCRIYCLAEGRLVNLVCRVGHYSPAAA